MADPATDRDRIRAACDRAVEAIQRARPLQPEAIHMQTSPVCYPSRPTMPMPEYLQPDLTPFAAEMATALAPLFAPAPTRDSDLPAVVSPCA